MNDQLLKINEITKILNIGRNKVYDLINSGQFINPVKIPGCGLRLYSQKDLMNWIEERKSENNKKLKFK